MVNSREHIKSQQALIRPKPKAAQTVTDETDAERISLSRPVVLPP